MDTAQRFKSTEEESKLPHVTSNSAPDWISVELSSRRTGMSFQRTRMSADRTLMSVVRTSLSLISFGFTIFQFFGKLSFTSTPGRTQAVQHFSLALVLLGSAMLVLGIGYHLAFMRGLRKERTQMKQDGLIHGESCYPVSLTLITAIILFLIGMFAIASMIFHVGPFA
jgi:putative membrane protein